MGIRFRLGEKGLYRMMNAAFLVCLVLFGAGKYLGIASPGWLHVLIGFFAVLLLTCFNYLSARGRILSVLGVAGCLCATGLVVGFDNSARFLTSYGRWILNKPLWQEEWLRGYEVIQVLLVVSICYLVQMIQEKDFRIKLTGALLLLASLLYCFFTEEELSRVGVALIICYLVMVATEWTQRRWKKVKTRSLQAYMLWMVPFLAVYLLLLLWMPVPQKPYDWKLFKDIYQQISESFRTITQNVFSGNREDYDLGLSGFSESGGLGNGFLTNDREIMTIQGNRGLVTNVYLIGKVYDTFDGSQWQQLCEDTSRDWYLDTVETLYAVQRYDNEFESDYVARTELEIRYQYFNSGYLFAPLKTWGLENDGKNLYFENLSGSLMFEEKKGYGTEYATIFYQMNMDQEIFYEFLEAEQEPDEELLKSIFSNLEARTNEEFTVEDLEQHRQMIYTSYLEDISLSSEVEAYLAQITQNAETDVEKLKAIETALSSFTYNQTPGNLPDTVIDSSTFLDYFLLESREGYCSHFATAFALLARAEGIPTRYVQGYCVPMQKNKETVVTSDMAHAWPEVYLEDIGWIPFEPTPGYGKMRYKPWDIRQDDPIFSSGTGAGYGTGTQKAEVPEEPIEEVVEKMEEETSQAGNWKLIFRIVFLTFCVVITVGVLVLLLERLIGRYRYRKMNEQQRYTAEIRRNLRILSQLGLERREGETLEELQGRMNSTLGLDPAFRFVEEYEEVLYGESTVDFKMIQLAKEEQDKLLHILKQKKQWSYLYYCVFMNGYRF